MSSRKTLLRLRRFLLLLPLLTIIQFLSLGNASNVERVMIPYGHSETITPLNIGSGTSTEKLASATSATTFLLPRLRCSSTGETPLKLLTRICLYLNDKVFIFNRISLKDEPPDRLQVCVLCWHQVDESEGRCPACGSAYEKDKIVAMQLQTNCESSTADVYGQAAYNLVAGNTLETTIQYLLDMDGGSWTMNMVVRVLRAAYNNPARTVGYLYSGIPKSAEVPPVSATLASGQAVNLPPAQAPQAPVPASGPNANPVDLFPQGLPTVYVNANAGNLDFLLNSQQVLHFLGEISFTGLIAMYQNNDFGKDKVAAVHTSPLAAPARGNTLETTIQDLLDMSGGSWTWDMVVRVLRAAYNNPSRAVDYLYSVISH